MRYDIDFTVPDKKGRCTATLIEQDDSGTQTGRSWNTPFYEQWQDDAVRMSSVKENLYAKKDEDDVDIATVNTLRDKAIAATITTAPTLTTAK